MVCMPGTTQACYDGPTGTKGVGACKEGEQKCLSDGSGFGPCNGEVMPAQNDCGPPGVDADCDGVVSPCPGSTVFGEIFPASGIIQGPAIDPAGDVFLFGDRGLPGAPLDFGGAMLPTTNSNVFVVKLSPTAGKAFWAKAFTSGYASIVSFAVTPGGNLLLGGTFESMFGNLVIDGVTLQPVKRHLREHVRKPRDRRRDSSARVGLHGLPCRAGRRHRRPGLGFRGQR